MKIIIMSEIFIHPSAFFIVGGILIPFLNGRVKKSYMILVALLSFLAVIIMPHGTHGVSAPVSFLEN